jgi:hypothetical protein
MKKLFITGVLATAVAFMYAGSGYGVSFKPSKENSIQASQNYQDTTTGKKKKHKKMKDTSSGPSTDTSRIQ